MVDLTSIATVTSSLNAAVNIAKAAVGLRDAELLRAKVLEMQGEISAALGGACAAQMDQLTLIDRIRNLESQIADLEAWAAKEERYELYQWPVGSFTCRQKHGVQPLKVAHEVCTNCFEHKRLSVLQPSQESWYVTLFCPECRTHFRTKPISMGRS